MSALVSTVRAHKGAERGINEDAYEGRKIDNPICQPSRKDPGTPQNQYRGGNKKDHSINNRMIGGEPCERDLPAQLKIQGKGGQHALLFRLRAKTDLRGEKRSTLSVLRNSMRSWNSKG